MSKSRRDVFLLGFLLFITEGNLSKELLSKFSLTSTRLRQSQIPRSKPNHWLSGMRITVIGSKNGLKKCDSASAAGEESAFPEFTGI